MSRRRDVERHRESLGEIGEIMRSMKTLAYMETRKLARFLPAQTAVVASIEEVTADFLAFHPHLLPEAAEQPPVYLLIGSERGFCGDFNHALLAQLQLQLQQSQRHVTGSAPRLVAVGHKLHPLLEQDDRVAALVPGASVAEEVPAVLELLVTELAKLQASLGRLSLYGIYHQGQEVAVDRLLPPFRRVPQAASSWGHAPLLQVPAEDFLLDLIDHYVFAALHQMLYASLMEENRRRVAHLEGATRHLDDKYADLGRLSNMLRQEEIIEEIEVILLNSATLADGGSGAAWTQR
jgi:F-type H+-transporting ATPase subunit gamma